MIQYGDLNSNVHTDDILLLLDEKDAEYCINAPSMLHMVEYYFLKSQSHDPDNPTYMEALLGKNLEEYFKEMDDEIKSRMRRKTWDIFQGSKLLITKYLQ